MRKYVKYVFIIYLPVKASGGGGGFASLPPPFLILQLSTVCNIFEYLKSLNSTNSCPSYVKDTSPLHNGTFTCHRNLKTKSCLPATTRQLQDEQ